MNISQKEKILRETREIYNRIAPDFANTRNKWWRAFGDFQKYVKAGDRVLDLGCGNGRLATLFENSQTDYLGLDNSEELIKIARERFKGRKNFQFEVGDILEIENWKPVVSKAEPAVIGTYDLVLFIAVLHHLPSRALRQQALKNIYQALKPGGRLVVSNWNLFQKEQFKRYWRHLFDYRTKSRYRVWGLRDAFIPWKLKNNWQRRYIHTFSQREIKRLLTAAGFFAEDVFYEHKGVRTSFWRGSNLVAIARKK